MPSQPSPLLLLAVLAPATLAGDLGFEPPLVLTLPEGTRPKLLLATDVTGDGDADLVVASSVAGAVVVRNGEGSFEFGASITTALPAPVDRWESGDMNGDGLGDLVARLQGDGHVRVLLADGLGAFTSAGVLDVSGLGLFADVALLDANEDGQLDVALLAGGKIRVSPGDGAGQLAAPGPGLDDPPSVSASFDLHSLAVNGDGHADLAVVGVTGFGGPAWGAFLGDGAGGFTLAPGAGTGSPAATTHASAIGDLDGDGWSDLLVSFQDGFLFFDPGTVQIARGTGGSLQGSYPGDAVGLPDDIGPLQVADLDGDGFGDMVGTRAWSGGSTVWIFRGDGAFGFDAPLQAPVLPGAGDLASADLDLDGVPDIVVTHEPGDAVTVLRNTALPQGWSDLGGALGGSAGTPALAGSGTLQSGQLAQVQLSSAQPLAPVALIVGLSQVSLPFKGGELVPSPDVALVGFTTDAAGALLLQARWPAGLPAGFAVWMQAWVVDAAGPKGYAASNGLGAKQP